MPVGIDLAVLVLLAASACSPDYRGDTVSLETTPFAIADQTVRLTALSGIPANLGQRVPDRAAPREWRSNRTQPPS